MNVLHVSESYAIGGAGLGVQNLHEAMIKIGINSNVLTLRINEKNTHKNTKLARNIFTRSSRYLAAMHSNVIRKKFPNREDGLFSLNLRGANLVNYINKKNPDIVNLHWINNHMLSIRDISHIKSPIVWTMRDLWPITGGCHYKGGCRRNVHNCGKCPMLASSIQDDISSKIMNNKRKYWISENIYPVGISDWVTKEANLTALFSNSAVTILNCVHPKYSKELNDEVFDFKLRLEQIEKYDTYHICIAALNVDRDKRKGFNYALEALQIFSKHARLNVEIHILGNSKSMRKISFPKKFKVNYYGLISSHEKMIQVYEKCHVLLAPATEEAFGKTIAEAMCQGTVPVVFDGSGPETFIKHQKNGYISNNYSADSLFEGLIYCANADSWHVMAKEAMFFAHYNFSAKESAKKYQLKYLEVMHNS